MAYTKQNFEDGQVLTAEHLNNIERGIENAVSITEQNLTEEQKAQVRMNIGVFLEDDEDDIVTKEVTYTYDGDLESNDKTWVNAPNGARAFVKVADIPDGELNLSGGVVNVLVPHDSWQNHEYTITDEMLNETVNVGGVDIKASVNGLTQIFYQHAGAGDPTPNTNLAVCIRPGSYDIAFGGWMALINFPEKGIYFLDNRSFGGSKYVASLICTVTTMSGETEETEESPIEYSGNEIQSFSRGICIGDSITEGVFNHTDGQIVIKKYSYPSVLKRMTGIEIVNAGVGGLTSKTWYDASINSDSAYGTWVNNEWVWHMSPETAEGDVASKALDYSGFDFAIIHLGINDIGMMGDATLDSTISTFETNINNIIDKLKAANNGIKVFLATIIPCYAVPGYTAYEVLNEKIRSIANATEDVFLIDLNVYSECFHGTPYENQHLTAIGYCKMATEIKSLINYTMKQHLNEFKNVQFIGTTYNV